MAVDNQAQRELALLMQSVQGNQGRQQQPSGGLFSGPILDAIRKPGRERKAAQEASEAADLQLSRAQSELDSSGVDLSTQRPEVISGLMSGLQDIDPKRVDAARADLQEIAAQQGIRPAAQTQTQRDQSRAAQQAFDQSASRELREVAQAGRLQNAAKLEFDKAVNTQTSALRGQYHTAIKPVVSMLQSVEMARGQMALGDPESAFNGARIFIQQLDKSMVTNPELQAIMQQPGVAGQVDNLISWLKGNGKFDDNSRKRMIRSMSAIGQVMKSHGDGIVEDMTGIVERNALPLDVNNVITMGGFNNRDFDLSTPTGTAESDIDPALLPPGVTPL